MTLLVLCNFALLGTVHFTYPNLTLAAAAAAATAAGAAAAAAGADVGCCVAARADVVAVMKEELYLVTTRQCWSQTRYRKTSFMYLGLSRFF